MSNYEFKPKLWPTIFTLILLVCLLSLGFWQVYRLEWKLGLIEKLEARINQPPIELPVFENIDDLEYLNVKLTGQFDHSLEMTMYSIGPTGKPGYDLYTPFILENGDAVIVNRGWVPEILKEQISRPDTIKTLSNEISGPLRGPGKKLWFGPENEPENNNWFYGNINQMAQKTGLENIFPMYLYASRMEGNNELPIAGRTELNIVNNHLDYVMTWFGLAIVLVGIYILTHIRKKSDI